MRRAALEPGGEEPNVLAPILERHLLKGAGAFTDSTIIVAQNLDILPGQIARPANPGQIGIMALRGEWPNKQHPRHRVYYLVEHGVKMCAGYGEVSGALLKLAVRLDLILHSNALIWTCPEFGLALSVRPQRLTRDPERSR